MPTSGGLPTVSNEAEFRRRWDGVHNFALARYLIPFEFDLPAVDEVVSELLRDRDSVVVNGGLDPFVHTPRCDLREQMLQLPIERVLQQQLSICHYDLRRFDTPAGLLEGLEDQLLRPWRHFLERQDFTLTSYFQPYLFISGPGCAAEYHMDFSHVLACQYYGTKRFFSFAEPERWADQIVRRRMFTEGHNAYTQPVPEGVDRAAVVCCEMHRGDRLWNVLQTPHWVLGGEEISVSLNIAHRGIRHRGHLCPHEEQLEHWRAALAEDG